MALQPDLPCFGSDQGYEIWQTELESRRTDLERKLGIPIGAKIRLTLADFERPFIGVLEMVPGTDERNPRLRIRGMAFDFGLDEITSVQKFE